MRHVRKIKLVIAYDGTNYAGWQMQKNGIAVQQKVEEALAQLFQTRIQIQSSSRTDSGVHALGMVAHTELPVAKFRLSERKLALAINAYLPADIRIVSARRTSAAFHARFDASGKQYRYFAWNDFVMNPLLRTYAWHVPLSLDLDGMRSAAKILIGKHDFRSFAATRGYEVESSIRTLTRCDIKRSGRLITFIIEGDGFLYKMCRGLVGTLVQVGQGKFAAADLRLMVQAKDRRHAGMTAPAHGLVLWKVFYRKRKQRES